MSEDLKDFLKLEDEKLIRILIMLEAVNDHILEERVWRTNGLEKG